MNQPEIESPPNPSPLRMDSRRNSTDEIQSILDAYQHVRNRSREICDPLATEDYVIQSMPDASPTRWHLAHTTWFFETFCLKAVPGYVPVHPAFEMLFNSYYNTIGEPFPRDRRGLLSRPTVDEVWQYRDQVDQAMTTLLRRGDRSEFVSDDILQTGLNHEQQHQELMLTDLLHAFSCNPIHPVYDDGFCGPVTSIEPMRWIESPSERIETIGFEPDQRAAGWNASFCFDNELPRHRALLSPHAISNRLVTCGEFLEFIKDGGYEEPACWLSAGWAIAQSERWNAPLYWHRGDDGWHQFTLSGLRPIDTASPLMHVSYFEADAFARWSNARLPTEFEWEFAATQNASSFHDAFGVGWQWTSSDYAAYPGYAPPAGAIGEYNGKFMCGQKVLRGGSFATPFGHERTTYRNFFSPATRWQFSAVRLAKDS